MGVWANYVARHHVCTGITVIVEGSPQLDSLIRNGITEELQKYPMPLVGSELHQINIGEVEKYLSRRNNFESVNCMISSRGEIVVKVVPLIPVIRVFYGNNSYYINKDGKHIVSNAEYYSDVPVVSGKFTRNFTPKYVIPVANYIKENPVLNELVSMIYAEDKNNLILIPRIRGHVINIGDTSRLAEKTRNLDIFYREVMPFKGWEEYDTISVKYRGQVVATRRDKTVRMHSEEYEEEEDMEEGTLPVIETAGAETEIAGNTSGNAQTDEKKIDKKENKSRE